MKNLSIQKYVEGLSRRRGAVFGAILFAALLAFEAFNYSTTEFSLRDVFGGNSGLRWSVLLAIAFCGIDFAGLARMITPDEERRGSPEGWYLFGAWLLAGAMNAILTWWGVSVAITTHTAVGSAIISSQAMGRGVPVFVALMVWMIRILIIGTFAIAGERLFSVDDRRAKWQPQPARHQPAYNMTRPTPSAARPRPAGLTPSIPMASARALMEAQGNSSSSFRERPSVGRPEPTYHPVGLSASPADENAYTRQ
jgi:hypothetical protein